MSFWTSVAGRLADAPAAYVIGDATVPAALAPGSGLAGDRDGLAAADLLIEKGRIAEVRPAGMIRAEDPPVRISVDRGLALPLFVDMHTHLDKGHIWPRQRNPDGQFMSALLAVKADREAHWTAEDVRRRMHFSLRAAFAHGTRAIRTHIDSIPPQDALSWPVLAEVRQAWAGRIDLQAVSLVGPDTMMDPDTLAAIARTVRAHGGVFGGAIADWPTAREAVFNVVRTAERFGLDVDLHVDETEVPEATALRFLAEAVIETGFAGRVVAGHCCSLAQQDEATVDRTLDLVARAGVAVVSLPMCNMYLQDRHPTDDGSRRTPRWRGVTLLHEMRARGIPVAVASDNTRDPFYAYGDLDGLEVMREAFRILHLDHAPDDWFGIMSAMPADILGLPGQGRIAAGAAADLILVSARTPTELFARPQSDRIVLRDGRAQTAALPDFRDLDDLFGANTR